MFTFSEFSAELQQNNKPTDYCYRIGDACYLPVTAVYSTSSRYSLFVYLPCLKEVKLNKSPRQQKPETLYYRLSAADAKLCTGLTLPEIEIDEPAYLTEKEWDADKAIRVPLKCKLSELCMGYDVKSVNIQQSKNGTAIAYLKDPESRYSSDVVLTYPLGLILLVGVDIPCTVVGSVLSLPAMILN